MINYTEIVYTKEQPSTTGPLNDAYRRKQGTHKPFTATREQANAEWRRINAAEIAKARQERQQAARFAAKFRKGGAVDVEE